MEFDINKAKEISERLSKYFQNLIESQDYPELRNVKEYNEGFRLSELWREAIIYIEKSEFTQYESKKSQIMKGFNNDKFDGSGWHELKILATRWLENQISSD